MPVIVRFKLDKTTKSTYRFAEVGEDNEPIDWEDQVVGSIYVKKTFFNGGGEPSIVKIELERES